MAPAVTGQPLGSRADGKLRVYRKCGQLLAQQVGAAVKPHGAGVCAGRCGSWRAAAGGKDVPGWNCEGADGHREVDFNMTTSQTLTTAVLWWINDKSRFTVPSKCCWCLLFSLFQKHKKLKLFMIHFDENCPKKKVPTFSPSYYKASLSVCFSHILRTFHLISITLDRCVVRDTMKCSV